MVFALVAACAALLAGQRRSGGEIPADHRYDAATPNELDKVGILKVGPKKAPEKYRPQPRNLGQRGLLKRSRA